MNKTIEKFARNKLKEGLEQCSEPEILVFKRMYSHRDLDKDINDVVDDMSVEKLSHALTQVENTVNGTRNWK